MEAHPFREGLNSCLVVLDATQPDHSFLEGSSRTRHGRVTRRPSGTYHSALAPISCSSFATVFFNQLRTVA
jgi:hypothetical protein